MRILVEEEEDVVKQSDVGGKAVFSNPSEESVSGRRE